MSDDMLSLANKYSYLRDLTYQIADIGFPSHDNPYSKPYCKDGLRNFPQIQILNRS